MSLIERTISVNFPHRVYFTREAFAPENPLLADVLNARPGPVAKVLIVMDESLHRARPQLVKAIDDYGRQNTGKLAWAGPPVILEGGERVKNSYFHVSEIHSHLDRHHLDRHSYLLAVGGGALLDLAGLAAATAHRGLRLVRLPTTTLSQADSGVGVKNGINAFGKKNFIGTFAVPHAVINDFDLLSSLSARDKRGGYIEAVKVALIKDAAFFEKMENSAERLRRFDSAAMEELIQRCAELHLDHIATSGDPFEMGSARPLDFGHWAAHKLEQLSEFNLRHGEAVAIGIALDVIYSRRMGFLPAADEQRILDLIESLGFDLFTPELKHRDSGGTRLVIKGLEEFREHLGGELCITLLRGIGRGFEVHQMDAEAIESAIVELEKRHIDPVGR